jgi:rhodanese-related sulfurtransferase
MAVTTIQPQQLQEKIQQGQSVTLIDVRTPLEFQEVHAKAARNEPLDRLNVEKVAKQHGDTTQPIYVICRSGSRARQACERFQSAGMAHVVNVEGGTQAWDAAGLPVVRGKKVMSLERQVRIAAGTLVVLGAALGYFLHPAWIGLSAFVGAGLVFAGVTDTCGMGLLLARMPWNQVGTTKSSGGASPSDTSSACGTKSCS